MSIEDEAQAVRDWLMAKDAPMLIIDCFDRVDAARLNNEGRWLEIAEKLDQAKAAIRLLAEIGGE